MKIAILSDVHDCKENLRRALKQAATLGCEQLFFIGDIVELDSLFYLREKWQGQLEIVFGNNEYSRLAHREAAFIWPQTRHHGDHADFICSARRIYMSHYREDAQKAAEKGNYDAVFFGHSHRAHQERIGSTILVNPGEIQGRQSPPQFAVYDSIDNSVKQYIVL